MNNRQFDRSNSFTFFKNFKDTLDKYGAQFGTGVKLAMYDAIVDYGLYRRLPKDSLINTLLTPMMLDIDSSQERRAHGFRGGRPKAITAAQAKGIRQMRAKGNPSGTLQHSCRFPPARCPTSCIMIMLTLKMILKKNMKLKVMIYLKILMKPTMI